MGIAHVLEFVRFIDENKIANQFLCCKQLTERKTEQNVFDSISSYLDKFNITWDQCEGIYTDGTPSMIGSIKGFTTFAKKKNPNIISTHCFLHRESLISKTLPIALKSVLDQIVSMVNYIKSGPFQSRLFNKLCESMDTQHVCLLLHCELRWLSRGKVLNRILELKNELLMFFFKTKVTLFLYLFLQTIFGVLKWHI